MLEIHAGEERGFDVHDGDLARAERHAHRSGDRFRVDESMHHKGVQAWVRPLEPERPKDRELLATRLGGLQGQSPGHDPKILSPRESPKEGGALDDGEFERRAPIRVGDQPDARESEFAGVRRRGKAAEIEPARVEREASDLPVLNGEERDGRREDEPPRERLRHEAASLALPNPPARIGLDGDVLLVIEPGQALGEIARWRSKGPPSERASEFRDRLWREALPVAERILNERRGRVRLRLGRARERERSGRQPEADKERAPIAGRRGGFGRVLVGAGRLSFESHPAASIIKCAGGPSRAGRGRLPEIAAAGRSGIAAPEPSMPLSETTS
jgi:hypothetical protein